MALPEITHLQYLIISILVDGQMFGHELRAKMSSRGTKKSGPAFYQVMARLEDAKLVEGWYDEKVIDNQRLKERAYRITSNGLSAYEEARRFYSSPTRN